MHAHNYCFNGYFHYDPSQPIATLVLFLHLLWWRDGITNEEVRRCTAQPSLTPIIRITHLKFFGHTARANPSVDHSQALRACVAPLPRDWNRWSGRPRHTWLQTIESDLAPLSIGLATAYCRAQNRQAWSTLVGMAASSTGQATQWWWWWWWWLVMDLRILDNPKHLPSLLTLFTSTPSSFDVLYDLPSLVYNVWSRKKWNHSVLASRSSSNNFRSIASICSNVSWILFVEEFLLRLRCSPLYINMDFGLESMGGNGVSKMSA